MNTVCGPKESTGILGKDDCDLCGLCLSGRSLLGFRAGPSSNKAGDQLGWCLPGVGVLEAKSRERFMCHSSYS